MTVREILHAHIPTLSTTSTVRDAIDKMDVYQFPALVILDDHQAAIGVITEGDITRAMSGNDGLAKISQRPATSYATMNPQCAGPDAEINDALHLMISSGLTLLPITEENRTLGIVLRVDLMHAILNDLSS